jgi:baculoviral IAP repeat-containing protein 6
VLEAIALNPRLVEFYASPRDEIECTDGLDRIISGHGQLVKKKDYSSSKRHPGSGNEAGTAPSLLDLMENLCKQAETFYKTMTNVSVNAADANVVNSVNLCKSIIGVRKLLESTARQTGCSNSVSALQQVDESDAYRVACADLAYDEFPQSISVPYYFTTIAQSLKAVNPRRTITLAKELSTMATSLPPGIFVRSAPNRPDWIKALIAGPEGTPYYGGLFEFDIFAPENYPSVPPGVQLITTANGKVRFNPNLYAYHLITRVD